MNAFEKIKKRIEEITLDRNEFGTIRGCNLGACKDYDCLKCLKMNVLSFVDEAEAEYGNGWIPCSERLPEKENVLCYAVSLARNPDTIFVGAYSNGVWFLQSAVATISYPTQYKVIAWMPLPEAYKPET